MAPLMECGNGGYKWGEKGVCFTGPEAKEKALAAGKAIKSQDIDSFIMHDRNLDISGNIDEVSGFLTAPVNLARTGIQEYFGYELGLDERALEKINVFRSSDEVFSKESMQSFINLVVTDNHPNSPVTLDNVKKLWKGSVSHVEKNEPVLTGIITITDKDQIAKIKGGKKQVSVGYSNDLIPEKGVYNGKKYEFVQKNIRANHLAIVDAGRCGTACKIIKDKKKESITMKVKLNGVEYTTDDVTLGQAIENLISLHDAEKAEMKKKSDEEKAEMQKKLDEEEAEKKKVTEEKDKVQAAKDALETDKLDDKAIAKLVDAKANLLSQARNVLGDKMPDCINCDQEIKILVIEDTLPDIDLKDKPTGYIDAMYDIAISNHDKNKETFNQLRNDFKDNKSNDLTDTRASVRSAYAKDHLGMEV